MSQEIAIITGANTGLGLQTARSLALLGYIVVLTGRHEGKITWASRSINSMCKDSGIRGKAIPMIMDLTSFDSIAAFAEEFNQLYNRLDLLICNAGMRKSEYTRSGDGYESHFQVHYLGHFLLFQLLIEKLRNSDSPRLIHVVSASGEKGTSSNMEAFDQLATVDKHSFSPFVSYSESNLAKMMNVRTLHRHFGSFLFTAAVYPGTVNTDLFYRQVPVFVKYLTKPIAWVGYIMGFLQTPAQGAGTVIRIAVEFKERTSGRYWYKRAPHPWPDKVLDNDSCELLYEWSVGQVSDYLGGDNTI